VGGNVGAAGVERLELAFEAAPEEESAGRDQGRAVSWRRLGVNARDPAGREVDLGDRREGLRIRSRTHDGAARTPTLRVGAVRGHVETGVVIGNVERVLAGMIGRR